MPGATTFMVPLYTNVAAMAFWMLTAEKPVFFNARKA
jgi:hypothetical protein